jgi:hypothetical protein
MIMYKPQNTPTHYTVKFILKRHISNYVKSIYPEKGILDRDDEDLLFVKGYQIRHYACLSEQDNFSST